MVKAKQKNSATVLSDDSNSSNFVDNSSAVDINLTEGDSWIIVKKQKVNVLIPRLPCTHKCSDPNLDVTQEEPCVKMPSNSTSSQPGALHQKLPRIILAETNDCSVPLSPKSNCLAEQDNGPAVLETVKPEQRKQNIEGQAAAFYRKNKSLPKFQGISQNFSRAIGQPRQLGISKLPTCTLGLNKVMRASILEAKIIKAGGLSKWLSSLGLERFERIFCGKNLNIFQLANLSMEKLKDMGVHAVGPRRKLVHAIEGLCQQNF